METVNHSNTERFFYWFFLVTLFLISLVSGIAGFYSYFVQQHQEYDWFRILYCTIQLFAFEGGDLSGPIPWSLQVARFAAGSTTALAIISALLGIFREQWNRFRIALMKNHVIIIGFGTKGKNILLESLSNHKKVVVIDNDPFNPNLSLVKANRYRLLIGDATGKNLLQKAAIHRASTVFLMMGDDNNEVNTCMTIYTIVKQEKRFDKAHPLQCIMHLHQTAFLNTMKNQQVFKNLDDGLSLNVFNVYENSARLFFEDHPPDREGITETSENFVQILIFGFGKAGEALALKAALNGSYSNGKKPKIVVIDRDADERIRDFLARYPTFTDYCRMEPVASEAESPQLINKISSYLSDPLALTSLVVCFDNKTLNILLGLQLLSMKQDNEESLLNVFVRTDDEIALKTLSDKLVAYGLTSETCSLKAIQEGRLDTKAKAFHENYLQLRGKKADFGTLDADVPWELLSQEFRDSNRNAADHIGVKVRSIHCEITEIRDERPQAVFTDKEKEKLSEMEHLRWNAERSLAGWTYDKVKNNKFRKTPYLTNWADLPENIKDYDRVAVNNIPDILGLAGQKVVRKEMKVEKSIK